MRRIPSLLTVAVSGSVLAVMLAASARADTWDQLTYFTFSAPVEIPGVALPAGTYMFKLANPDESRSVIRVLSQDGSHVYSTFLTIPDKRLTPTADPVVTFNETPAGMPEAIKAWFYPGNSIGHEFVYPKDQAQRIAAATNQSVLTSGSVPGNERPIAASSTTPVESFKNASVSRVDGHGAAQPIDSQTSSRSAPLKSLQTSSAAAASAATQAATTASNSSQAADSSQQLPRTATFLPLFGLIGVASLALGSAVHVWRKSVL